MRYIGMIEQYAMHKGEECVGDCKLPYINYTGCDMYHIKGVKEDFNEVKIEGYSYTVNENPVE